MNTDRGLTTDPPGFIAIKAKEPLGFDNKGRLELKGSSLLKVNENKGLTNGSSGIEVKLTQPLNFNNEGRVGLTVSAPLTTASDALGLSVEAPLTTSSDTLGLSVVSPLTTSSGTLGLSVIPPLTTSSNTLGLSIKQPLYLDNNDLAFNDANFIKSDQIQAPLTTISGNLALNTVAPITTSSGTLGLNIQQPLYLNNDTLAFNDAGFIKQDSLGGFNGKIDLNQSANEAPYISFNKDGTRYGYVGKGSTTDDNITLSSSRGDLRLEAPNNKQVISNAPFVYSGAKNCEFANGIRLSAIGSTATAFLAPNSGADMILKFKDPRAGTNQSRFATIDFENKTKIINCKEPEQPNDVATLQSILNMGVYGTLWTGSTYRNNTYLDQSGRPAAIFFLSLTSACGVVNGTFSITGAPGTNFEYFPLSVYSFTIKLEFDGSGVIQKTSNIDTSDWGYRFGDLTIPTPSHVPLKAFMPHSSIYRPTGTGSRIERNNIVMRAHPDANTISYYIVTVMLNKVATNYSIWIEFSNMNQSFGNRARLESSTFNFSYVAESV